MAECFICTKGPKGDTGSRGPQGPAGPSTSVLQVWRSTYGGTKPPYPYYLITDHNTIYSSENSRSSDQIMIRVQVMN